MREGNMERNSVDELKREILGLIAARESLEGFRLEWPSDNDKRIALSYCGDEEGPSNIFSVSAMECIEGQWWEYWWTVPISLERACKMVVNSRSAAIDDTIQSDEGRLYH
jgi:hypothetical protein